MSKELVTLKVSADECADVVAFLRRKADKLSFVVGKMQEIGLDIEATQNKWQRAVLDHTRNLGIYLQHGNQEDVEECVLLQTGWGG